jgi:hypothetical protein
MLANLVRWQWSRFRSLAFIIGIPLLLLIGQTFYRVPRRVALAFVTGVVIALLLNVVIDYLRPWEAIKRRLVAVRGRETLSFRRRRKDG